MEWQSEKERGLKRENADEMEVCTVQMSHYVWSFFHSVFSTLVQDVFQYLSLIFFLGFSVHTVLKSAKLNDHQFVIYASNFAHSDG